MTCTTTAFLHLKFSLSLSLSLSLFLFPLSQRQREAQAAVPPEEMFRSQTDKYSKFDEQGLPTHDTEGQPLGDKQLKKNRKAWQAQEKKYRDYQTRSKEEK